MKNALLLGILLLGSTSLSAQNQSDTIEVKQILIPVFRLHGKNLAPRQLLDLIQTNPGAYKEMQTAKRFGDIGDEFGFIGGFMIALPFGTALGGGNPNWKLAGIGAGLMVISVPFSVAYSRHAKNAVKNYNSGLRYSVMSPTRFRFGIADNRINLKIEF